MAHSILLNGWTLSDTSISENVEFVFKSAAQSKLTLWDRFARADDTKGGYGFKLSVPHQLRNIPGPQLVLSLQDILPTSGGGAWLEEVGHSGMGYTSKVISGPQALPFSQHPGCQKLKSSFLRYSYHHDALSKHLGPSHHGLKLFKPWAK